MTECEKEDSRVRRYWAKLISYLPDFSEPLGCLLMELNKRRQACMWGSQQWPQNLCSFVEHLVGLLFS